MPEKSLTYKRMRYIFWLLYLLSGFAGLVYEVVWVRLFGLKFGVSSLAVGSVLAAYMLGLAWGSFFWGRFTDRHKSPLKLYAMLELGVGLYALLLPSLLNLADKLYLELFRGYQGGFTALSAGRFVLALALLFPPTALMGGTLPVLAKFFVQKAELVGQEIGYLYGINILGAMLGCFSAGFFLLGSLGIQQTNYWAVALNLAVALTAFLLSSKFTPKEVEKSLTSSIPAWDDPETLRKIDSADNFGKGNMPKHQGALPQSWLYIILVVAAGAGFTSLSYEILWDRILALMLRNTVYAFSTMLTTFLGGLFLGSLLVGRLMKKEHPKLPHLLGLLELGIGAYALAVIPLFGRLNELFFSLEIEQGVFEHSWVLFSGGQFLICAAVMLLPAIMMGAIFPLVSKLYFMLPTTGQQTGRGIGRIYALNTLGAVLGSFVSSFLLIPWLGIQGSVFLAASINLFMGSLVIFMASRRISLVKGWVGALILLLGLAGWGATWDISFRGAIEAVGEEILFHHEDNSSLIEVTRKKDTGTRMLISNRQQQEGDSSWLSVYNQRKQVYLPLFLHPDPKRVLGIGLGTGISFAALTNYPLELAECVELSPGVIQAASFFAAENKNIVKSQRVKVIEADGRNYLRLTKNKYDLIVADLFSSYRAGVGNLYSREHYLQCKDKLAPEGIMCQWLPPHQLPGKSLKIIIKTFQGVFPHSSLWLTRQAMVLIATPRPLAIDYKRFKAYFEHETLALDLHFVGLQNPLSFLNSFLMGEKRLTEFVRGESVNTDDHPLIEFMTPKDFYLLTDRGLFEQHVAETSQYRESVYSYLVNVDEGNLEKQLEDNYTARQHTRQGEGLEAIGDYMGALSEFRTALYHDPAQAGARRAMGKYHLSQAQELVKGGLAEQAISAYRRALEMMPQSAQVHFELGKLYYQQRKYAQAQQEFFVTTKIDPYNQQVKDYLRKIP